MFVGIVRVELHIPAARSLKDKRQVVRALKDRLRERLHAAVAEVDHQDLWQRAALGLAVVSGESGQVREQLQSARRIVEQEYAAQITDWQENIE
ncbi:MAG: DUF503 domain-containing protein [Candidatus Eisenbacteria bacterium]|uniref:DUF503 domain-containing protein n=1 Tax=Eiseniibacteriota bacterium TaxID=2212470 RepID=A0A933SFM4_UNCEI|nr:DUF503 domain-containing protein [Candidatus Eisenbacteria bacterium]